MTKLINLQNTPTPSSVETETVEFKSGDATLKGILYKPSRNALAKLFGGGKRPAAIVTGAWTTVKEQMPGTYARELAERGFYALAFDFAGWGESGGTVRYVEDPVAKTADIHAAVEYLAGRSDVDTEHLVGLGVCASSGYMADAVADNPKLQKLALVAPWLHDPQMAEGIYGGPESAAGLIASTEAAEASGEETIALAASATDENSVMYQAPYYTEENRGLIDAYDNKFNVLSWKPWLTYDAQKSADRLTKPAFLVGSTGMALPAGADAYEQRTKAPLQKLWFGDDVNQFDFYDRSDIVAAASDAVAEFFKG